MAPAGQPEQLLTHQPSPRLVPLPPSLVPSPNLSTNSSSLALPPPSPALSDSGFSAFETSPMSMQDATFNFAQHFDTRHQFDDPPEEPTAATPVLVQESEAPLDPPPSLLGDHLPPSPTSFVPSLNSLASTDLSDYSPSPSIASVRMAQLVTRLPPHRMLNGDDPSRLSVATSQSTRSSLRMSVTETDEEEEGTVWDAKRLSRPAKPATRSASAPLEQLKAAVDKEAQARKEAVDPAELQTALEVEGAKLQSVVKSSSEGSVASWKDNLDAAVREMTAGDVDPAIRPEADAMTRMKSLLGPKMKIISKAPWDPDGSDGTLSPDAPPTPPKPVRTRSSMDALRSVASLSASSRAAKLPIKENEKPKSSARSKSFSILNSRKPAQTEADIKASEEAFRGLGLGVTGVNLAQFESSSSLSSKALPIGQSFLDLDDEKPKPLPPKKKQSTPAPTNPSAFTFPPPPSSPPSPPKSRKSFSSSSRVRPPPITFEMIIPSSSMHPLASPNATSIPRSAPPHMASFVTVPRSDSNASLGVRAPKASASGSSLATSGSSSPSTPTGMTTAFPPSPTSPTGSYFSPTRSGAASPTGPGYKLISLEEARERESQRIAAALAKKEKAMTPVEHIAGREDVMYGGSSRDRSREHTAESVARTRATSGPASSAASTAPSHGSSPSTSTLAQAPIKTLKAKKSGFLRRMMGADKAPPIEQQQPSLPSPPLSDLARFDSATTSTQLATSPSYSVTISSPHASVDLRRANNDQGGLTPSPSVSSTAAAPASRVSFLPTPAPDPELRLRKGLAPSLSLRPVSMAFSAGLPSDFLANVASESTLSSSSSTPSAPTKAGGWISPPSTSPITSSQRPTSPTESLIACSGPSSAQSPFAPSFASSTTAGQSSLFERDEDLATTPVTPAFPSSPTTAMPTSPSGSYAALQEEYARARKAWKSQQWELETQIRVLQAELEQATAAQVGEGAECHECGAAYKTNLSPSIVQRPRFKGHGGSGALYGSGLAV